MSYEFYDNEYLHWDGTETVTITLRRNGGDQSILSVTAKRGDQSDFRTNGGGVSLNADSLQWFVPDMLLPSGEQLREGDKITDASGANHRVTRARVARFGTQWICETHQERT